MTTPHRKPADRPTETRADFTAFVTPGPTVTRSLAVHCVVLAAFLLLMFIAVAWIGYRSHGDDGLIAACVAAIACTVGSILGLCAVGIFRGKQAAAGVLAAILARTGIPLAAAAIVTAIGPACASANFLEMLLGCYLASLVIDTGLAVHLVKAQQPPARA